VSCYLSCYDPRIRCEIHCERESDREIHAWTLLQSVYAEWRSSSGESHLESASHSAIQSESHYESDYPACWDCGAWGSS
jgi:hypothetical protein